MIAPLLAGTIASMNIALVYPAAAFLMLISFTLLKISVKPVEKIYESEA